MMKFLEITLLAAGGFAFGINFIALSPNLIQEATVGGLVLPTVAIIIGIYIRVAE